MNDKERADLLLLRLNETLSRALEAEGKLESVEIALRDQREETAKYRIATFHEYDRANEALTQLAAIEEYAIPFLGSATSLAFCNLCRQKPDGHKPKCPLRNLPLAASATARKARRWDRNQEALAFIDRAAQIMEKQERDDPDGVKDRKRMAKKCRTHDTLMERLKPFIQVCRGGISGNSSCREKWPGEKRAEDDWEDRWCYICQLREILDQVKKVK